VSWGVCRPDLRNRVAPGDVVVFVAADRLRDHRPARYRLAGWGTVERLVSQVSIWQIEDLSVYRTYRNLLVHPATDGRNYVHHEAQVPWHQDWLWRLANPPRHGPRKPAWESAGASGTFANGMISVAGQRFDVAANYIVFTAEGDRSEVLADPPVIATAASRSELETWCHDGFAVHLKNVLMEGVTSRGLRTTNPQQPHRHRRLDADAVTVRTRLSKLISDYQVQPR
jgi:hypothetical protein